MLCSLAIRNFVLFEDIDVEFGTRLNVISGETGGGKSNLTQALSLLRGARARKDQIRKGTDGAEICGTFETSSNTIEISRWIPPTGPGRITIDGKPATLSDLRTLGEKLLSITSQHEQVSLTDPDAHRSILDSSGNLESKLDAYRSCFSLCHELSTSLEDLRVAERDREVRQEFLRHQVREISNARPRPGEDEALEREIKVLRNAEKIRTSLATAVQSLYEDEGSAIERVGTATRDLERLAPVMDDLAEPLRSINEASALLEDATRTLSTRLESIDMDPAALEAKQERAYMLDRLKKRHGPALEDVLDKLASMESELSSLESLEDRITETRRELEQEAGRARDLAAKLTRARRRASTKLSRAILAELHKLAFESVQFEVHVTERAPEGLIGGLDETGQDDVRFMFRPNVGEGLAPLDAIASGGELSRVFLAIRSVLGRGDPDETLVFDEADTGIGGKTADALGLMLHDIGHHQQVLCVTHLAQIAAHADTHVIVAKTTQKGRTRSRADVLDDASRRDEIARMLGGEKITSKSREAASELLKLACKNREGRS